MKRVRNVFGNCFSERCSVNQCDDIVRIGVDFDGVITANPLRIARPAIAFVKHKLLKIRSLNFFVPKNGWQKFIYVAGVVIPSLLPARGVNLMKSKSKVSNYQFFLVTGRFGFVKQNTYSWLRNNQLSDVFTEIFINERNEQPHKFKERIIRKMRFDYYIEDNWDIVNKLRGKLPTKILWIYNFLDRSKKYPDKYPDLHSALRAIEKYHEISD